MSFVYQTESRRLSEYECHVNQYFDHSVFVSQNEADLFLRLYPQGRNVSIIPNGVDCEYFSPANPQPATRNSQPILLFTGAMDYYPNVDGVNWFCNEILPLVLNKFSKTQFYVVGGNPHPKIKALTRNDSIKVTGFVEDVRPYYQSADICVVPLSLARGVQNKVLEAMAMKKPVVATTKALEGIKALPREHVLIADTAQEFFTTICELLENKALSRRLGVRAREFVLKNHNWSTHMQGLESLLCENR